MGEEGFEPPAIPKQKTHDSADGGAFSDARKPKTGPEGLIADPDLRAFIREVAEAIHRGAIRQSN